MSSDGRFFPGLRLTRCAGPEGGRRTATRLRIPASPPPARRGGSRRCALGSVVDALAQLLCELERRLRAMGQELEKAAQLPIYREHIAWLRCFRGIDTTVAMIFVAELQGIERFDSPRALAAYLGLVPTLYASGDAQKRGGITKTRNAPIRRALV